MLDFPESHLIHDRVYSGASLYVNASSQGYYKRGVLKQPPKHFLAEVLPHKKLGGTYAYGMRIFPINAAGLPRGDNVSFRTSSSSSSSSSSSGGSGTRLPYEVWRRWEDCLWFQEQLEGEYKVLAHQKRTRLQRGKGVKKDGVYVHSDQAASFESLPPGPDASDIAKSIHAILPVLSKKGTFFKASKETADQRQREFKALIEKFWDDNLPTLVKEMRDVREIRDFFGYWNRDRDRERKTASMLTQDKGKSRMSMSSLTSSMFSSHTDSNFSSYPSSPLSASSLSVSTQGTSGRPSAGRPRAASAPKLSPLKTSVMPSSPVSTQTKARSSTLSVPKSVSERSLWDHSPHTPTMPVPHMSFTVAKGGALVPTMPWADGEDPLASSFLVFSTAAESKAMATGGLEVLREEHESEIDVEAPSSPAPTPAAPQTAHNGLPEVIRRPRKISCPDPGVRNGQVWLHRSPRPQSTASEVSVLNSPISASSSEGPPTEHWEDALDGFASEQSDAEHGGALSRRASMRSAAGRSVQRGSPSRPFTMYSTFSTVTQQDAYLDEFYLGEGFDADEIPGYTSDGAMASRRAQQVRASVATMNSVVSGSSVDAVLPRHSLSMSPPEMSLDRPESPTPSSAASSSSDHTHIRTSSPTPSSSPSLRTPSVNMTRSVSSGSRKYKVNMAVPDSPLFTPSEEGQWYGEAQDEDLIDSYFYDPGLHPPRPGSETPHRERVSQNISEIWTPEHFPKPFQHRPPGQFHLPWSPTRSSSSSLTSPTSPTMSSGGPEQFTVKAVRQDSIVLLRASYTMSLAQMRDKLRDKFAAQEGIRLTDAFTIGFNPVPAKAGGGARPRSSSGYDGQQRLRFISSDDDWEQAALGCPGKLTIHVFDRF